jgi:transcription initiation factor IIE alpha subunit
MEYTYQCSSSGSRNNKLKSSCEFEAVLGEGPHHCPICGAELRLASTGKTVSEFLQEGLRKFEAQQAAKAKTKSKGTNNKT